MFCKDYNASGRRAALVAKLEERRYFSALITTCLTLVMGTGVFLYLPLCGAKLFFWWRSECKELKRMGCMWFFFSRAEEEH